MTSLGQGISRRLFFRCPTRPLFAISEAGIDRGRADMRFRVKFGTFLRGIVLAATASFAASGAAAQQGAATGQTVITAEIGRASCRERVCQYVSISVVAVSLKNNRNTHIIE